MASTLRGPSAQVICSQCQYESEVGAEFAAQVHQVICPHCSLRQMQLKTQSWQRSDRLWIDRTALQLRPPRRWEVVVVRCPHDSAQLCVKRIVGLPGESVELRDGDVWIDGKVAVKSLAQQHALRQSLAVEVAPHRESGSGWVPEAEAWRHTGGKPETWSWLQFSTVNNRPITDECTYNAGLSRQLNLVRDLMFTGQIDVAGSGRLVLEIYDGRQPVCITIAPGEGTGTVEVDGQQRQTWALSSASCQRLRQGVVRWQLSNFDRHLFLALDGHLELRFPLSSEAPVVGVRRPFRVGAAGLQVRLSQWAFYRDVHYQQLRTKIAEGGKGPISLGEGEYFLLGDNVPISRDSRHWGPISARLLVGKPLGVR